MTTTLEPILKALGYTSDVRQRALIKLLAVSGAFGQLPNVDGLVSDAQAEGILKNVSFESPHDAVQWLHGVTQEFFLREHGRERHECTEPDVYKTRRAELLSVLHEVGILSEVAPKSKHYDHVLVLGAMEGAANTRIDMVKDTWDRGVRFGQVHVLGSDRPLEPAHEPVAALGLSTEMQMMTAHYREKRSGWPQELQIVPACEVNTANNPDGTRANTQDTIRSWISTNPKPGRVLVISSQPHVAYQDAAVKSILPANFEVETIGARINHSTMSITVAMDAIARQIDVGLPRLMEKLNAQTPEANPDIVMIDPARIQVDAAAYQFRSGGHSGSGVTNRKWTSATSWDPALNSKPLLVHERFDGTLYVADGHHRLDLAKRLNAQGTGPGPVSAIVLREADGYTVRDAKIVGAYKNFAEGSGRLLETAQVFQEVQSGGVHTQLLPPLDMNKGNLKQALALSTSLSSGALNYAASQRLPGNMVSEVARRVPDKEQQETVMRHIGEKLSHVAKLKQSSTEVSYGRSC